ncbi:MAG: cell wall-associated protease [Granulosicoccus sp.]|jgi:cell wall-associated protease
MIHFPKAIALLLTFCIGTTVFASTEPDSTSKYWHHMDPETDGVAGVSSTRAYKLVKDRKSTTVTVAIIDSGMDIDHEDLKENIWTNEDEIPGNGIDDDKNGYVDDIHGWNFLGTADGTNMQFANLEMTRIFRKLDPKFSGKTKKEIAKEDRADFELYTEVATAIAEKRQSSEGEFMQVMGIKMFFDQADSAVVSNIGEGYTLEELAVYETKDEEVRKYAEFILMMSAQGMDKEGLTEYYEHLEAGMKYHYNPGFNDRDIMGDDLTKTDERLYGNNDVSAPDAVHGTHVGGLVGSIRGNGLGGDGICQNVKLMALRAVPNGDEFDKDIANAIRYAADNGAQIINMSFGKGYSPQVEAVYEAIKYAESKNVLLIHAAGNDGANNDKVTGFPNPKFSKKERASSFLTIGASSPELNASLPGIFSNYGKKEVDFFAPGVQVYSTMPGNEYEPQDGTSMAAPVTTGVAAFVLSYFPKLTAVQLKDLLISSVYKPGKMKVTQPDPTYAGGKLVPFKKLSKTGGVVNAYNAAKMALEMYP